jgi:hypothetical protein
MTEGDEPELPKPVASSPGEGPRDQQQLKQYLISLRSDPAALEKLRNDPAGYATLMSLAAHGEWGQDRRLAAIYLAVAFADDPNVKIFLFDRLPREGAADRDAVLAAILANYGHDTTAMARLVAIIQHLAPGAIADLLALCLDPNRAFLWPAPMGISEDVWDDWIFAARSAALPVLLRNDLQSLLLDVMRRDPDGPVECVLDDIVRRWRQHPPQPPAKKAWVFEERWDDNTRERAKRASVRAPFLNDAAKASDPRIRAQILKNLAKMDALYSQRPIPDTPPARVQHRVWRFIKPAAEQEAAWAGLADHVRDLSAKAADMHPKWPSMDGYVKELDTVHQRRLPGWARGLRMFDIDLEWREARIVARLARFPDAAAVRRTLETLLLERAAIWPQVRDECDYTFEPVGWRRTAWIALTETHVTVTEAIAFARRIVSDGPWDREARKSKEAIIAVACAWPNDAGVLAFLAELAERADVGAFVREDVGRLLERAQAGKSVRLADALYVDPR